MGGRAVGAAPRPPNSEVEAKRRFKLPEFLGIHRRSIALVLDKPEWAGAVDIQTRAWRRCSARVRRVTQIRHGMIEDIRCIHANLKRFEFTYPNRLLQCRVEAPLTGQL